MYSQCRPRLSWEGCGRKAQTENKAIIGNHRFLSLRASPQGYRVKMSLFCQIGQFFSLFWNWNWKKKFQDNLIIFVADLRWRAQGQESMIPNNGLVFSLGLASYFRSLWIYFDSLDKNNARFWIVRVFFIRTYVFKFAYHCFHFPMSAFAKYSDTLLSSV